MSSVWDQVKNAGNKTKLRGEIALLERQAKTRQQAFGVELYDLLVAEKGAFVVKTPPVFHANEQKIRTPFEACKRDVDRMTADKLIHLQQIDTIQANRERTIPAYTAQEKLNNAGKWISGAGSEGKLQAQIALLNRQMKQRKEAFGLEVFHLLGNNDTNAASSNGSSGGGGIKSVLSNQLSKLSTTEKKIEECVIEAKRDVAVTQRQIDVKLREIESYQV